jgi:hypothetical protein
VASRQISRGTTGAVFVAATASTVLVLVLLGAVVTLAALTGDLASVSDGAGLLPPTLVLAVGWIIAYKRPSNPIGWLALATAFVLVLGHLVRLYAVLDYHHHHDRLPFGRPAVFLDDTLWPYGFVLLATIILLFPDGRIPSRRWRLALIGMVAAFGLVMASLYVEEVADLRGPFHVDPVTGESSSNATLHGLAAGLAAAGDLAAVLVPVFIIACLARLVLSWRGAVGDRRQQLKWLMLGAGFALAGGLLNFASNAQLAGTTQHVVNAVSNILVAVLPLSLGLAVLRYRLYEIDRLISRTISYLVLTGLLVGVFVAVVLVTTRVLPFSSPVGVAASTLAAAALFTPLRNRVQRLVDRRFNRSRYDAETIIAGFSEQLRGAVDPETVELGLLAAVTETIAPAHASVWLRSRATPGPPPR